MASTLALAYELWGQVHEPEYVSVDKVWGVVVLMGHVEFRFNLTSTDPPKIPGGSCAQGAVGVLAMLPGTWGMGGRCLQ